MINLCKISNCERPVANRNTMLCRLHYGRLIRNGNPLKVIRRTKGTGCLSSGYKYITINGKHIREHRYIMELTIGRKLMKKELVHHIDGNGLNNSIDNLELINIVDHLKLHHIKTFRNDTHKECNICHRIKPRKLFGINYSANQNNSKDSNHSYCYECKTKCDLDWQRIRRKKNKLE